MKYILILLVFLTGCSNSDSADTYHISMGKDVYFDKGFYKGCHGIAINYFDYDYIDDKVIVKNMTCENGITVDTMVTEVAKNVSRK